MPALGPCSGAALRWRPVARGAWAAARQALEQAARGLAAAYHEAFKQEGLAFGLSLGILEVGGGRGPNARGLACGHLRGSLLGAGAELPLATGPAAILQRACTCCRCARQNRPLMRSAALDPFVHISTRCPSAHSPPCLCAPPLQHRALLFAVAEAVELLDCAQAAEAAAGVALAVPAEGGAEAGSPAQAASTAGGSQDVPADLEDGKLSGGAACPAAAPAVHGAVAPRPSTLHRLAANPYIASCAFLLLLASPLPLAALVAAACWRAARALPALARSRAARRAGESCSMRAGRPHAPRCRVPVCASAGCLRSPPRAHPALMTGPTRSCCSAAQPARAIRPQVLVGYLWNGSRRPCPCLEGAPWLPGQGCSGKGRGLRPH